MRLRVKRLILLIAIFAIASMPLLVSASVAPDITSKGTQGYYGPIYNEAYAWTGTNGYWARTEIMVYDQLSNAYKGVLVSKYDASGWAQTAQGMYSRASYYIKTKHSTDGLVEYSYPSF